MRPRAKERQILHIEKRYSGMTIFRMLLTYCITVPCVRMDVHMYNAAKIALLNFITALDGFSHRASSAFLNTLCRFFLSTKRVTGIQLFKE